MFVVFAVARIFTATGAPIAQGYLWYLPAVALCWAAGAAVARYFSQPCERMMLNLRSRAAPRLAV